MTSETEMALMVAGGKERKKKKKEAFDLINENQEKSQETEGPSKYRKAQRWGKRWPLSNTYSEQDIYFISEESSTEKPDGHLTVIFNYFHSKNI